MKNKVLILNEFEENENIEEVFYDLDGIVIEDILSIKKMMERYRLMKYLKYQVLLTPLRRMAFCFARNYQKPNVKQLLI